MASRNSEGLPGSEPEASLTQHTLGLAPPAPLSTWLLSLMLIIFWAARSRQNSTYLPNQALPVRAQAPDSRRIKTSPAPHQHLRTRPPAGRGACRPRLCSAGTAALCTFPAPSSPVLQQAEQTSPAPLPESHESPLFTHRSTTALRDLRLNPTSFQQGSSYAPLPRCPEAKPPAVAGSRGGRSPGGQRWPEPCPG